MVLLCQTSKSCEVQWYKDGILIQDTSKRQTIRSDTEATLTIRGVGERDAGTYKCEAGGARTEARVTVKGKDRVRPGTTQCWNPVSHSLFIPLIVTSSSHVTSSLHRSTGILTPRFLVTSTLNLVHADPFIE